MIMTSRTLLAVIMAGSASAQMVSWDVSKGEFSIKCEADAYCVFSEGASFGGFDFGPMPLITMDQYRLGPMNTYYFSPNADKETSISGIDCMQNGTASSNCFAICDQTKCGCLNDATNTNFDNAKNETTEWGSLTDVESCPIAEELPDTSIVSPETFVTYKSSARKTDEQVEHSDTVSFRCPDQFATCTPMAFIDLDVFAGNVPVETSADLYWGRDFTDCTTDRADGTCYTTCDPRCTCVETFLVPSATNGTMVAEERACVTGGPPMIGEQEGETTDGQQGGHTRPPSGTTLQSDAAAAKMGSLSLAGVALLFSAWMM